MWFNLVESLQNNKIQTHSDFILFCSCVQKQQHIHSICIVSHLPEFTIQNAGQPLYLFIYSFSFFQENGYQECEFPLAFFPRNQDMS